MNNTPNNSILLRNAILLQLDTAAPASLPLDTILHGLRLAGYNLTQQSLAKEIAYLADKHFLYHSPHPLSPHAARFTISANGRDYLQSACLA